MHQSLSSGFRDGQVQPADIAPDVYRAAGCALRRACGAMLPLRLKPGVSSCAKLPRSLMPFRVLEGPL
jgi:hypothetical protein